MTINQTANEIIIALTPSGPVPAWIQQAALVMHPSDFGKPYDTTAVNFFPEVTVRVKTDQLTRRGQPKPQRRRLDLVALVQSNYRQWQPFIAGLEIKINPHDLEGDHKMEQYLEYCHLFYLAVPPRLAPQALQKIDRSPALTGCGLLIIIDDLVRIQRHPTQRRPTSPNLAALYAELLIRPFKLAKKSCKNFYQFKETNQ